MLALSDLVVIPDWNDSLLILKVKDICGLSEASMGDLEGRRRPSWIWTMNTGVGDDAGNMGDEGMYPLIPQD